MTYIQPTAIQQGVIHVKGKHQRKTDDHNQAHMSKGHDPCPRSGFHWWRVGAYKAWLPEVCGPIMRFSFCLPARGRGWYRAAACPDQAMAGTRGGTKERNRKRRERGWKERKVDEGERERMSAGAIEKGRKSAERGKMQLIKESLGKGGKGKVEGRHRGTKRI